MSKINVTYIDSLDISQMTNTQVTVSGSLMTLTPLPSDESDYEQGMRRAMQKIAASCGRVFGADVGYEDLPDLVESIVRSKKESTKPKPTKFVKVEESIFDLKEEFERGELYVNDYDGHHTQILDEKNLFLAAFNNSIYRQVEIDWRDELVSFVDSCECLNLDVHLRCFDKTPAVPYEEKLHSEFISLCQRVAELTDKPE